MGFTSAFRVRRSLSHISKPEISPPTLLLAFLQERKRRENPSSELCKDRTLEAPIRRSKASSGVLLQQGACWIIQEDFPDRTLKPSSFKNPEGGDLGGSVCVSAQTGTRRQCLDAKLQVCVQRSGRPLLERPETAAKFILAEQLAVLPFYGRVEELLVAEELWNDHKKPFFFPFSSAATCTNPSLEVDQSASCEFETDGL
ncbi:hypothetical protein Taro_044976 [Colocasia esculenta]|uniref:Uncharacterized protein n=1 Tax=Colocasia esculenta TaxID=4460 RepID=A0A843X3J2_COLES|nr:hypothetical protein [Colocasia esculenta]